MIPDPCRIDVLCKQAAVAACVGAGNRYRLEKDNLLAADLLMAEAQMLVGWFEEIGLGPEYVDREILDSAEDEVIARHGHEVGPRLAAHLRTAFALAWARSSVSGRSLAPLS